MTCSSPGDGVSFTSPSSSSRHGHSNEPSYIPPSPSLTLPSLSLLIQRLVDLLILTPPTSPAHLHLTTALDHAITAATRMATQPSSPSPPSPPLSHSPITTPVHQFTSHTIRIVTPILPLSPLPPPSTSSQSLRGGATKTPCRQPNSVSYAALSSCTASRLATASAEKKRCWASLLTSPSPSPSPSSATPSASPPCPPPSSPSAVSDTVMVETSCVQPNSASHAAVSSSLMPERMQSEEGEEDKDGAVQQGVAAIPAPSSASTSSASLPSSAASPPLGSETESVSSSCRQLTNLVVFAAVSSLSTPQLVGGKTTGQESGQWAEAVDSDADDTSPHTPLTTTPSPHIHPTPIPRSAAVSAVVQSKPSAESAQVGGRRRRSIAIVYVGKRKSKVVGGGSKRKRSKKMMP